MVLDRKENSASSSGYDWVASPRTGCSEPDYARRVYVGVPLFWEDWEVPYHFRSESPPFFAYLGFQLMTEGPDSPFWYVVLSEYSAVCLKALYYEVMDQKKIFWVPDEVRRAWRLMDVEQMLTGCSPDIVGKVKALADFVERVRWGSIPMGYRLPPVRPGPFTPVYTNGDFVPFAVVAWKPMLVAAYMPGIAPRSERERVTGQHDRGQRQYGDTRTQTREGYPARLRPSDRNQRNPDRFGLSKREKNAGERALFKMIEVAGYSKTLEDLGIARFLRFEDIVETLGFLTNRNFGNAPVFQNGMVEVAQHWKEWAPGQA